MIDRSTISTLLRSATEELRRGGVDNPRFEAQALLADLIGVDRGVLLARVAESLPATDVSAFAERIRRRAGREPFQQIVGRVEFLDLELEVDPRALIPRPETELLVESALALELPREAKVVDLGTGSGCIAVALAFRRPDWRLSAVDRSRDCIALARRNAQRHGVVGRIELVEADFAACPANWSARFDLVVSNPPYVSEDEWQSLDPEVRDHEPREALVPGPTGLEAYESIAVSSRRLLRTGGKLLLEVGFGQAEPVTRILGGRGFREIGRHEDFQGIQRVVAATRLQGGDDDHDR